MSIEPSIDWLSPDDPDIIIRSQQAVSIYNNREGAVVLRQQADWCDDEDSAILIQRQHAIRIARAILVAAERPIPADFPEESEDEEADAVAPVANTVALPVVKAGKPKTNGKTPNADPPLPLLAGGGASG